MPSVSTSFHRPWWFSKSTAWCLTTKNSSTLLFYMSYVAVFCNQSMWCYWSICEGLITEQPLPPSAHNILPEAATAQAHLNTEPDALTFKMWWKDNVAAILKKVEKLNPRTSLLPRQPKLKHEQSLSTGGPSAVSHWREQQRRDMKPWQAATVWAGSQDLPSLFSLTLWILWIQLSHWSLRACPAHDEGIFIMLLVKGAFFLHRSR